MLMIRIIATMLLTLFAEPSLQVANPTAEDLLDGAIKAIGGALAIESLESFKLHGMIRLPDGRPVIEVDLATAVGGKVLAIQTFVGIGQTRFGSDGTTAWEENPGPSKTQVFKLIDDSVLSQKVKQLNWIEWLTSLPNQLNVMVVQVKRNSTEKPAGSSTSRAKASLTLGNKLFSQKQRNGSLADKPSSIRIMETPLLISILESGGL
jgi:hypothetical protein